MGRPASSLIPLFALAAILTLGGCASYTDLPPGTVLPVSVSPVIDQEDLSVPLFAAEEPPPLDYVVGPGDVLFVNVNGRPELGSPGTTGGAASIRGSRVDGGGSLRLPLVGSVAVAGLTVAEVQERLRDVFALYLNTPWVVVEVADYKSQPLYLLGQFRNAGTYYMDRPLNLLQGLALGGGVLDTANLRSARLIRDGETVPVDIYQLLRQGETLGNPWLKPGDTLYVPDDKNQNVFVFGAVKKPGAVAMPNGRLSLTQALAAAGIDGTTDNAKHLRIIRSHSPTRGELIVVDLEQILRGRSLPYPLVEGDIVYVPRSAVGNWNQALGEILPSLQTVSAILQPFVQIKFLQEN